MHLTVQRFPGKHRALSLVPVPGNKNGQELSADVPASPQTPGPERDGDRRFLPRLWKI